MSYDILYRKAFIKVNEKEVIPFYESGSNNSYEASNPNKRSRCWHTESYHTKGGFIISNEELIKKIEAERDNLAERYKDQNEQYFDDKFFYFTSLKVNGKRNTTFNDYKNYYLNGIKNSMTIEEYEEKNVQFVMYPNIYNVEKAKEKGIVIKPAVLFESTEHMLKTIKEFTEFYKDTNVRCNIELVSEWAYDMMLRDKKWERKIKKSNKPKKPALTNNYWTITVNKDGSEGAYLYKMTRYGYKYCYYPAKKFETENKANSYLKRIRKTNSFGIKFISN